ncbi:MAG TPA: aminotransferase class V-fold PLP-dependent enzyme [Myxococcales bacterium]|jgi:selenocysteine lyase/cysteine desulfurase
MNRGEAFQELTRAVGAALETYSNVHRGSGQHSLVSTHLYEQARDVVLQHLGLRADRHVVLFCTPRRAAMLAAQLAPGTYQSVSSAELGLPLGVRALAVERRALPREAPFQTGGGTARLVSPGSVVWARAPDRFEAGTPAIVNVIAMAKALKLVKSHGRDAFLGTTAAEPMAASEILHRDTLGGLSGRALLEGLRQTLIGRGAQVPTAEGLRPYVNLDNAASTPTFEPIWDAVREAWGQPREVQEDLVREVRSICAQALGAPQDAYDVVFTSNTTEAINLVAESLAKTSGAAPGGEVVVLNTLLEHNSNELPWRTTRGLSLVRLGVDSEGFVDPKELEAVLRAYNEAGEHGPKRIGLVAVSGASNVLGVFNDLSSISRIVHQYGARLLVDAAQMVAHRKVEVAAREIDYLVFSAHKVYAPFGTGALVVRKGFLTFSPAELEQIRACGEENMGGIAGLGKALELLQRIGMDVLQADEQALTRRALQGLATVPGLTLFGTKDVGSPRFVHRGGVVAFNLKGMMADRTARGLAERAGIGVRWGCHCAHLLIKHLLGIPPLLQRFQNLIVRLFPRIALPGVVRASFGLQTTEEDVDALVRALREIAAAPRRRADLRKSLEDFKAAAARRVYEAASSTG